MLLNMLSSEFEIDDVFLVSKLRGRPEQYPDLHYGKNLAGFRCPDFQTTSSCQRRKIDIQALIEFAK